MQQLSAAAEVSDAGTGQCEELSCVKPTRLLYKMSSSQFSHQWSHCLRLTTLEHRLSFITMKITAVCVLVCVCVSVAVAMPQGFQQGEQKFPGGGKDGGWNVGVDKTRGGGTQVQAEAQKKWDVSDNGKTQAEVHGHWDRTYGGPNHGNRDHGFGGSIGGSWGKK